MKKTILLLIPFLLLICGCKSCLNKFYGVHENPIPLKIIFNEENEKIARLKTYIDSINAIQKKKALKCPIEMMKVEDGDKIICVGELDCECYLLSFEDKKVIIECVFMSTISKEWWLCSQNKIESKELHEIRENFKTKVIDKL